MRVSDAKRLEELKTEDGRLKRPRHMVSCGLSECRSLRVIGVGASTLRYEPAGSQNCSLKDKIIALTQRYSLYGAGMICLRLRGKSSKFLLPDVEHLPLKKFLISALWF